MPSVGRAFHNLALGAQFTIALIVFLLVCAAGGVAIARSIIVGQTLLQGRSVARMVDHIGAWSSQYGGVYVSGAGASGPGTSLSRRDCPAPDPAGPADNLAAGRFYWKNPALVQREISDLSRLSPEAITFRITAASVINPRNAPDEFERAALEDIRAQDEARNSAARTPKSGNLPLEYYRVEQGRLKYARAITASTSCLQCHGGRPENQRFMALNPQFDPNGGQDYRPGRPAGIVSVNMPMPGAFEAVLGSMTAGGWAGLGAIVAAGLGILAFFLRRVIVPIVALRHLADALVESRSPHEFRAAEREVGAVISSPNNEVHRLGRAIARLGRSLRHLRARSESTSR